MVMDIPPSALPLASQTELKMTAKGFRYLTLLRYWTAMAAGRSYWHVAQGLGSQFVPGVLAGYFNDMRAKADWPGPIDERGLPVARVNGKMLYFPTTILQKGLGHWDRWLQAGRCKTAEYEEFARVVRWVVSAQDHLGGWPMPVVEPAAVSPYSAMIQGQGISVLCRSCLVTGSRQQLAAAMRAAELMLTPVILGGTSRSSSAGIILEEVPTYQPMTVLNGWIFALFGLYDLALLSPDRVITSSLSSSVHALARLLPTFDSGFWSYYDSCGALASPFYHRLHIAQLRAMQVAFVEHSPAFVSVADQYEYYLSRTHHRIRAVLMKGYQKLRNPQAVIVE
jgi:heparosan-N-sulfate-glucuronate 5-epimerase